MSEKNHNDFPFFQRKEGVVVWRGRSWGVREVGGCGSRYADIICIFCTRNETVLPFMSAKMSWMSSPNSIKHFQVNCIFNSYTDYYNT